MVSGNNETSKGMILEQVRVKPGAVLTTPDVSRARSNLYRTGAYQLVDVTHPVANDGAALSLKPNQVPADLSVAVHEIRTFRILAGGYYDTDRGPGAIADTSNRNSLGDARVLGLRLRYDADLQEARLYFSQPFLRRFPVRTTGEHYFTREVEPAFVSEIWGVSLGQEARFRNRYVLDYGYQVQRVQVFNRTAAPLASTAETAQNGGIFTSGPSSSTDLIEGAAPIPPYSHITRRLAPLTVTVSRDTRDDILDATHGQFFSNGLAIGFDFLGSQEQYVKYFAQYFRYLPLGKPLPVPFKHNLKRPRFVYAGGIRLGLAGGLGGQPLIQSERFFAGGGTTIRGFKQNDVGPKNPDGVPVGGNAMILINNEVRVPLWKFFDGAAFLDAGNVYARVQDFNPLKIRSSAGLGLRVRTPWVVIRADYGLKLGRHPGEPPGAFFVSVGQAF
jgi:outer membrane protein assembly factor BamA